MALTNIEIKLRRSTSSTPLGNLPALMKMNDAAVNHLSTVDPILGALIAKVGPCGLKPDHARSPFQALVQAVAHSPALADGREPTTLGKAPVFR